MGNNIEIPPNYNRPNRPDRGKQTDGAPYVWEHQE